MYSAVRINNKFVVLKVNVVVDFVDVCFYVFESYYKYAPISSSSYVS